MDLYFLKYNNYYNRVLKIGSDYLPDYEDYFVGTVPGSRFNPHDGVSTVLDSTPYMEEDNLPDYCLVGEGTEVKSRWFVIDAVRIRQGQYNFTLYRDLLADFYNEIKEAPVFVEKGTLSATSPLLFNQEDITFNQIRKEPTLLYDKTECPWVVGYIPSNAFEENKTISKTIGLAAEDADFEVEHIEDWEYANLVGRPVYLNPTPTVRARYNTTEIRGYSKQLKSYLVNASTDSVSKETVEPPHQGDWEGTYGWQPPEPINLRTFKDGLFADETTKGYIDGFVNGTYTPITQAIASSLDDINGQIIKDTTTNLYYTIRVENTPFQEEKMLNAANSLRTSIKNAFLSSFGTAPNTGSTTNTTFSIYTEGTQYTIYLDQFFLTLSTTIGPDRYHLEDQPYDMFCIPYGEINITDDQTFGFTSTRAAASIATEITRDLGAGSVYDVQILPYCPIPYAVSEGPVIDPRRIKHSFITDGANNKISAIFWCRSSSFQVELPYSIPKINTALGIKVASQTKKYRLTSPNYNGAFDFDPQKNGGVTHFAADCTYKPFNPYIRVYPVFNGLYGYGGQYDARGLILGGDFSLPRVESAWANYQEQNKNYQAIFDRQIENIEINNKYQRVNEYFGAFTGAGSAAMSGAITGAMMGSGGGAYGAAIGAGAGATLGIAGGIADLVMNEKLRSEAIDFTKDNFGYQLGNIQAIPTSLTKTSALSINNSLVPMLETYECTTQETNAFINKMMFNGMTVMTIGTIDEYMNQKVFADGYNYFKGKLIRLDTIADDTHIINAIANELNKGVYL